MGEVLDQSEVDALLAAVGGGEVEIPQEARTTERAVAVYDFKRPERVSKDQLRSLETLHEVYARNLQANLSAHLRTIVEVRLETVDQLTYSEFIMSLPNPTCFNVLSVEPLKGNIMLELNPSMVFPIFARLEGEGKVSGAPPERPLTEIEWRVMSSIIDRATEALRQLWTKVVPVEMQVTTTETNPQLVQLVPPNELVVLISFELTMGEHKGMMNLCVPFMVIEPVIAEFSPHTWFGYARAPGTTAACLADTIGTCEVDLDCILAETEIRLSQFLDLEPGQILMTPKGAREPLVVRIARNSKFLASPGQFRRHYALKVTGVAPPDPA